MSRKTVMPARSCAMSIQFWFKSPRSLLSEQPEALNDIEILEHALHWDRTPKNSPESLLDLGQASTPNRTRAEVPKQDKPSPPTSRICIQAIGFSPIRDVDPVTSATGTVACAAIDSQVG
jgi:hypothetical protein